EMPADATPAPADNVDDLFGAPADNAEPAPAPAPAAGESIDDLFGAPPAADEAPAAEEPAPAENTQPAADPFADPFSSLEMRRWKDNTGEFEVNGKLVVLAADYVRLLKDNGRHCTVPMNRLSQVDREYVEAFAAKNGLDRVEHLASR
ncbi:MAG: hypothetical protein KDA59_04515, partial [Planctomycetales bacterium]|nr:hypothetical protein [Planctomycetales bacterium]